MHARMADAKVAPDEISMGPSASKLARPLWQS